MNEQRPLKESGSRPSAVLCLLDFVLGNMIIHYSKTRVLHPGQGLDDIAEILNEEGLFGQGIKLVYCLVGRASSHLGPSAFICLFEKLLISLARINPRIMCVIGGVILCPGDGPQDRENIIEINLKLARLAEQDHHWLFFNPNITLSFGGVPQKKFFDAKGQVVKPGCRVLAQALVSASKSARMLQNYAVLPPIHFAV